MKNKEREKERMEKPGKRVSMERVDSYEQLNYEVTVKW
jgi:hypothetical protein